MKIKLSWWASENENHTSEWNVPWSDMWPIRRAIDDHLDLERLRLENYKLKDAARKTLAGAKEAFKPHGAVICHMEHVKLAEALNELSVLVPEEK